MKKKVFVLFGGISPEKEVSIETGRACQAAVLELGYSVLAMDVNLNNPGCVIKEMLEFKPDYVFNALHGGQGENGNWQAVCNILNIPYTHSGVLASAVGMNKFFANNIFEQHNIPTPKTKLIDVSEIQALTTFPCVLKPVDGGSSIGVYIIKSAAELKDVNWVYGEQVLVQEYIPGRELTVGVCNGRALEITEIVPRSGFYDYDTKYSEDMAEHILPAKISEYDREKIFSYAETAYKALNCRGIARVDFRYNTLPYILEVNTQPGMTKFSLIPEQAKYNGISFNDLVQMMLNQARCD